VQALVLAQNDILLLNNISKGRKPHYGK